MCWVCAEIRRGDSYALIVVIHQVGAGDVTWVLRKNNKEALSPEPSLTSFQSFLPRHRLIPLEQSPSNVIVPSAGLSSCNSLPQLPSQELIYLPPGRKRISIQIIPLKYSKIKKK